MPGYLDELGWGEKIALVGQAMNASLNKRDGFMEAMQMADQMVSKKKQLRMTQETQALVQTLLAGTSTPDALAQFKNADPQLAAGLLTQMMQDKLKQATEERGLAKEKELITYRSEQEVKAKKAQIDADWQQQKAVGETVQAMRGGAEVGTVPQPATVGPTNANAAALASGEPGFLAMSGAVPTPAAPPALGGGFFDQAGVQMPGAEPGQRVVSAPKDFSSLPAELQPFFLEAEKHISEQQSKRSSVAQREASATSTMSLIDSKIAEANARIESAETRGKDRAEIQSLREERLRLERERFEEAKRQADPSYQKGKSKAIAEGAYEGSGEKKEEREDARAARTAAQKRMDELRKRWSGREIPKESQADIENELRRLRSLGAK